MYIHMNKYYLLYRYQHMYRYRYILFRRLSDDVKQRVQRSLKCSLGRFSKCFSFIC